MFLLTLLFVTTACNAMHISDTENKAPTQWALLVAGSKGWSNYRHQGIPFLKINNVLENLHVGFELYNSTEDNKHSNELQPITNNLSSNIIKDKNIKEKDQFDIFGEHIASSLRNFKDPYKQRTAEFQIRNSLYKLEVQEYQEEQDLLDLQPRFYWPTIGPFDDAVEFEMTADKDL